MAPLFGSNDDVAVRWHLPRLYELGVLRDREILCEVEGAIYDGNLGAFVVTDERLIFVRRPFLGRKTMVVSIPLGETEGTEVLDSKHPGYRKHGAVAVLWSRLTEPKARGDVDLRSGLGQFASVLGENEFVCLVQRSAWLGSRLGRLVVTERRLAFLMGGDPLATPLPRLG